MITLGQIMPGNFMDLREELIAIYPSLHKFAASRLRDSHAGEDLVLEACKRMLEREESLDPSTNLVAYGSTIIKNLINDEGRVLARERQERERQEEAPGIVDHAQPGSEFELLQVLDTLGEECQRILEYFGMGYSYKEISGVMVIPIGTVMSRMSRCRDQFKLALEA